MTDVDRRADFWNSTLPVLEATEKPLPELAGAFLLLHYMRVSYKNTMHGMVKIESSVVRT